MILRVCDRFNVDPDTAGELDASVVGVIRRELERKAGDVG